MANVTREAFGIPVRVCESELELAKMGWVGELQRLRSTQNMQIIFTAATVVAEPVAPSVTRIAVEYTPRIRCDGEEGEGMVLVGGVSDDLRELGTT